ncbi:MAG: hypothetical protein ACRDTT_16440 [Pseudonocardiaceae bacterium]
MTATASSSRVGRRIPALGRALAATPQARPADERVRSLPGVA